LCLSRTVSDYINSNRIFSLLERTVVELIVLIFFTLLYIISSLIASSFNRFFGYCFVSTFNSCRFSFFITLILSWNIDVGIKSEGLIYWNWHVKLSRPPTYFLKEVSSLSCVLVLIAPSLAAIAFILAQVGPLLSYQNVFRFCTCSIKFVLVYVNHVTSSWPIFDRIGPTRQICTRKIELWWEGSRRKVVNLWSCLYLLKLSRVMLKLFCAASCIRLIVPGCLSWHSALCKRCSSWFETCSKMCLNVQ